MTVPRRLPADFSASAAYPLFAIDFAQRQGHVLHFTRDDYLRASFLDARALEHRRVSGWTVKLAELAPLFEAAPTPEIQWLFHIGHCGSTLCSQLLDLLADALVLREPLPLLALAQHRVAPEAEAWTPTTIRMLARGFEGTRAVVVKPTSMVTILSRRLLQMTHGRACLLWIDLQSWLATILREETLRATTLSSEEMRSWTGAGAGAGAEEASGDGERLARIWLSEQLRWNALSADPVHAGRLMDLNFAVVLEDPAEAIASLASHYGLAVPPDWRERVKASGLLDKYAKDHRQAFDAAARQREIAAAALRHRDDIEAGLRWAMHALSAQPGNDWLIQRLRP
jgi:hypothetical protein